MFGEHSHSHLASSLSVDVLRDDNKRHLENMKEMYRLYEELRKKVNGLYTKDIHDIERPKVDILYDEVWAKIIELEEKK